VTLAVPGVVAPTTYPHYGSPKTCCSQGRQRGATGHGGGAEGEEGGDAAERATEAAARSRGCRGCD
jgi:hypothetical protein